MQKIQIITTLGPATLKPKILRLIKTKVDLVRLNMSHLNLDSLEKNLRLLKKMGFRNICLDTEGAQIRTCKIKKKKFFNKNDIIFLNGKKKLPNNINLYPDFNFENIKLNTLVKIGFNGLVLRIKKKLSNGMMCKVIQSGLIENNKGVHFDSPVKLSPLTKKDIEAIKIAKKYKIKNFALSFANSALDVNLLKSLIPYKINLISKIESRSGFLKRKEIIKASSQVLIDRGDLSRYIDISKIPIAQKFIFDDAKKLKTKVLVATNLLETMIYNNEPTRAESNDIFSLLSGGCKGLVLAAETAIGKYPIDSINFLNKCVKVFNSRSKFKTKKNYIFS